MHAISLLWGMKSETSILGILATMATLHDSMLHLANLVFQTLYDMQGHVIFFLHMERGVMQAYMNM